MSNNQINKKGYKPIPKPKDRLPSVPGYQPKPPTKNTENSPKPKPPKSE